MVENQNTIPPKPGNGEQEPFPKHWFCAAIPSSGTTYKKDAESPAVFQELLGKSLIAWVDYRTENFERDAPIAAAQLGFSEALVSSLINDSHLSYQDFDTEMGIKLPTIQIRELQVESHPLILLLRKNFVLSLHPTYVDRRFVRFRRYADIFMKKIPVDVPQEDRLTMLLMRVIDETNERNFEHLREVEELGDELNKDLMNPETPREELGPKIYEMKHALITYMDALWQTVDVLHALRYGDAELITDNQKLLIRMSVLEEDVNRQIGLAEHMSEVLASGLEVLQSIYNNQLQAFNNKLALIMTYLTILGTAVLVPNTIATIFGSSAFNLKPNDRGWYIGLLVGSTMVATGLTFLWMRRHWASRRVDR
ncbi:MAG: magnesium transporter CorA [Chloroflexi bacterium]|nr:magnesium transporter CorA [Chloroflexota bacterium]